MFFKNSLESTDFEEVNFAKRKDKALPNLSPIATQLLPLREEKVADLNLLKPFISPTNRSYYDTFCKSLKSSKTIQNTIYLSEDEDVDEDFSSA
ncbi:hypothetical protein V9T40_010014 [Parthenolecanium corni]|uniref:Uncharacterized protein n=1 Tax=Parthenolecanium corni TaxID=536013 RepID=A0AAN9TYY3_9HEMI